MPDPKKFDTWDDFRKVCIPMVIKDGTAKDAGQAFKICQNMWKNRNKKSRIKNGKLQILQERSFNMEFTDEGRQQLMKPLIQLKPDENGLLRLPRSTLIVGDGIYNDVWHPKEEIEKAYTTMDRQPLLLNHDHDVLSEVGFHKSPMYDTKTMKLSAVPILNMNTRYGENTLAHIQNRLLAGKSPETSVGFWCEEVIEEIEELGKEIITARDWEFDHNSIVYRGACGPDDGAGIGLNQLNLNNNGGKNMEKEKEKPEPEDEGDVAKPIVVAKPSDEEKDAAKDAVPTKEDIRNIIQEEMKAKETQNIRDSQLAEFRKAMSEKKYEDADKIAKSLGLIKEETNDTDEELVKRVDTLERSLATRTTLTRDFMEDGAKIKLKKGSRQHKTMEALITKGILKAVADGNNVNIKVEGHYDEVPEWMLPKESD